MKKEIIICIIVILIVVLLNMLTSKYTENTMQDMELKLEELREDLISSNLDDIESKTEKIVSFWNTKKSNLAYYIEHTELEKFELYLVEVKSNIDMGEYATSVSSLDSCNYMISHIKDKYKFTLSNIF